MKKLLALLAGIFLLTGIVGAVSPDLEAEGRGVTEYEASQQALMNLASQLEVNVKTFTGGAEVFSEGSSGSSGDSELVSDVLITTNIIIAGARFKAYPPKDKNDPWLVLASLNYGESRNLYLRKIQDISREITLLAGLVSPDMSMSLQEQYYRDLSRLVDDFRKYSNVAACMGAKPSEIPVLPVRATDLKVRLQELVARVDSIDRLAARIARDLAAQGDVSGRISVSIPVRSGSTKVTGLGLALQSRLLVALVKAGFLVQDDPRGVKYLLATTWASSPDEAKTPSLIFTSVLSGTKAPESGLAVKAVSLTVAEAAVKEYSHD